MAIGEMSESDMSATDANEPETDASGHRAQANSTGGKKYSKYRIAAVLGFFAVCLYVLSIVSIVFSRGVGG